MARNDIIAVHALGEEIGKVGMELQPFIGGIYKAFFDVLLGNLPFPTPLGTFI